ncbi:MAG: FAD-dependent oxidoreductase, partial [Candidatus Aminicenantes bacterium]|nr:FAD-dependent oxidoreductase [Candidatus Aminicenantes bacterium]
LLLNDALSCYRNFKVKNKNSRLPRSKLLFKKKTIEIFPGIDKDGLKGGALWHDACLTDFQRFYIELLKFSCTNGISALNYVEVTGLLQQHGVTRGVAAIDIITGKKIEFKAPCVINAAGPWARETAEIFDRDYPELFEKRLLLWNVLFDREALSSHALALSPGKGGGHYYFLLSWDGRLLAGTPEKIVEKSPAETSISQEDMDEFINDLNKIVPGLNLIQQDIVRIYPGVLPADREGKLTKRPAIIDHAKNGGTKGLYSIAGIKFTTSRLEADRLLKQIFPKVKKLSHDKLFADLKMEHYHFAYDWQPQGDEDLNVLREIIKNEAVLHLSDLILRRTSLGDNPKRAREILPRLRPLFDWPEKKWQEEVKLLEQQW